MTPLLIDIMLHYYCRADDYRDGDFSAPAVRDGVNWLRDEAKLIEHNKGGRNMYRLTDRGGVYVAALQAVPLPVQRWVMETPAMVGDTREGGAT